MFQGFQHSYHRRGGLNAFVIILVTLIIKWEAQAVIRINKWVNVSSWIFVLLSVSDSWPSAGKPLWINDCYHPADESITPPSGEKWQEWKKTLILTTGAGQLMVWTSLSTRDDLCWSNWIFKITFWYELFKAWTWEIFKSDAQAQVLDLQLIWSRLLL